MATNDHSMYIECTPTHNQSFNRLATYPPPLSLNHPVPQLFTDQEPRLHTH